MTAKAWAHDMVAVPSSFTNTLSLLEAEAADPHYLQTGATYTAQVAVDVDPLMFVLPFLPLGVETATVQVTNTGNVSSEFRAVGTGWWDYHLPGDWPLIGQLFGGVTLIKVPVSLSPPFGPGSVTLAPGAQTTFEIPYAGVYLDPLNAFSPHWLRVDVYSGPFPVPDSQSYPYFVLPGIPLSNAKAHQSVAFGMTFLKDGVSRAISAHNFGDFAPQITVLVDSTLSPLAPQIGTEFMVQSDTWSVEFQLAAELSGAAALRVCDDLGRCAGYDSTSGGVITEFPATVSGDGSMTQVVEIPNAGGQSFAVHAMLEGATSARPVRATLWALETPERPAVLATAPGQISRRLYRREQLLVPVTIAEAGGQVPLEDVSVTIGPVTGADPASTLTLESLGQYPLGLIGAARSQEVSFTLSVPNDAPFDTYIGTVSVESSNAGMQTIEVVAEVLTTGDADGDGDVDLLDFGRFQLCFSGEGPATLELGCDIIFDYEPDGNVDLDDFAFFHSNLTGPGGL